MNPRKLLPFALILAACNGGGGGMDATADADVVTATDATDSNPIAQLPAGPPRRIMGLDGAVDVVIDTHGWPHIYATTLHDAMYVEGLLVAEQRMPQMELIRRVGNGTLAEAFGSLAPNLVDQDISARVIGLRRVATQIYNAMPEGRSKSALRAYTAGINHYLADIRTGDATTPSGTELVVNSTTPDWTEIDSVVIARYQAFALSYDDGDIANSNDLAASNSTFDMADSVMHPDLAARHGFFWDTHRFAAPSTTYVIPDFYTSMGLHDEFLRSNARMPRVSQRVVRNVTPFLEATHQLAHYIANPDRGSNNWAVAGAATATGHAMLASDPHLSLTAPAVWWAVHITITGGPDAVDVTGVAFPGIPGLVLGYNTHIAWGATVAEYDVTDVFQETIVPGTGGQPDGVRRNGQTIPLQVIHETVNDGVGHMIDVPIEIVPQHGPILPTISNGQVLPRTGATALSIHWTGFEPTTEIEAVSGLWYANDVASARAALDGFGVGAQNWVIADTNGNIGYTTHANVPTRAAGARTWTPTNLTGTMPCMVLPGTGEAEWTGMVDPALLPQGTNTATRSFINTSNNDQAGLAADNNPLSHSVYLSCTWAEGWRAERVASRLSALTSGGAHVAIADMQSIQNDHQLLIGGRYRPFLQQAMTALQDEWAHPGTHPDLTAFATSSMPRSAALNDAAMRIMAWSLDSPSGMESDATDATRADSVATSLFHAWLGHVLADALDDEVSAMDSASGLPAGAGDRVRGVLYLLEHPDQTATRNAATGQSAIWDDLGTATVTETRDLILARALDRGMADLAAHAPSADVSMWLWGDFHFVRFDSIVPGPGAMLSIPPPGDTTFPRGFPRPGDIESVDPAWAGFTFPYNYGSGPSQRFTVDMDPAGPHGFNAIPGGEVFDVSSPHHRDEADLWRVNQVHPVPRTVAEVVAAFESHLRFVPM